MFKGKILCLVVICALVVMVGCDMFSGSDNDLVTADMELVVSNIQEIDYVDLLLLKEYSGTFMVEGLEEGTLIFETDKGDVVASKTNIVNGKADVASIYTDDSAAKLYVTVNNKNGAIVAETTVDLNPTEEGMSALAQSQGFYFWGLFLHEKFDNLYNEDNTLEENKSVRWDYYDVKYFMERTVIERVMFLSQINDDDFVVVSNRQNFKTWEDYESITDTLNVGANDFLTENHVSNVLYYYDAFTDNWYDVEREVTVLFDIVDELELIAELPYLSLARYEFEFNSIEEAIVDKIRAVVEQEPVRDVSTYTGGSHLTFDVNELSTMRELDINHDNEKLTIHALVYDADNELYVYGFEKVIDLNPTRTYEAAAEVSTWEELNTAVNDQDVTDILFTADITGCLELNRLVNLDFGEFTLTGDLNIDTVESGSMSLNGTADPSIDGDLIVNAANASIINNVKVSGDIEIIAIGNETWTEVADGNTITYTSSTGGRVVLNGENTNFTVTDKADGTLSIEVTGNVSSVNVSENSGSVNLNVKEEGKVETLNNDNQDTNIAGDGEVKNIEGEQAPKAEEGANLRGTIINVNTEKLYSSIQGAINVAEEGNTLKVYPGTYEENIEINVNELTIESVNGAEETIIRSDTEGIPGVVGIQGVGVTFAGFTVDNVSNSNPRALRMGTYAHNAEIKNNIFVNSFRGIQGGSAEYPYQGMADNVIISENIFNTAFGIGTTEDMANLLIVDNTFNTSEEAIGLGRRVEIVDRDGDVVKPYDDVNYLRENNSFVNDGGVVDWRGVYNSSQGTFHWTIQDAIDEAEEGNTILVAAGTYEESVTVNVDKLTLKSFDGPQNTQIIAQGGKTTKISANNVIFSGFKIERPDEVAFHLSRGIATGKSNDVKIENNIVISFNTGITFEEGGNDVEVKNNTFEWCLSAIGSTENMNRLKIYNNSFNNNRNSIGIADSTSDITITDNNFFIDDVEVLEDKFNSNARYISNRGELKGQSAENVIGNNEFNPVARFAIEVDNTTHILPAGSGEIPNVVNLNKLIGYDTIQAAIDEAEAGNTIIVNKGTYNENLIIDSKEVTLLSAEGNEATIIQPNSLQTNAIELRGNTTGVQIGAEGQGFTIVGCEPSNQGVETAAIYIKGTHSHLIVADNEIIAGGDAALMTEWGANISNMDIINNKFSGQTFVGDNPAGQGTSQQWDLFNVPRSLVYIGGENKININFKANEVIGIAGGLNEEGLPQGNQIVNIDSDGAVIEENYFAGNTAWSAASLRTRGTATVIKDNQFEGGELLNSHVVIGENAVAGGIESVLNQNSFDSAYYLEDGSIIYAKIQAALNWSVFVDNQSESNQMRTVDVAKQEGNNSVYVGYIQPHTPPERNVHQYNIADGSLMNNRGLSAAQPKGLVTDDRGYVYVGNREGAGSYLSEINIRNSDLSLVTTFDGGHSNFGGVAIYRDGNNYYLYIAREANGEINRYNVTDPENVSLDTSFGDDGSYTVPEGNKLRGITVDYDGTIFVADRDVGRMFRISSDLSTVTSVDITRPMDVAIYDGNAYITSYNGVNSLIRVVDKYDLSNVEDITISTIDGEEYSRASNEGWSGIDIDNNGRIWLCDQAYGNKQDRLLLSTPIPIK